MPRLISLTKEDFQSRRDESRCSGSSSLSVNPMSHERTAYVKRLMQLAPPVAVVRIIVVAPLAAPHLPPVAATAAHDSTNGEL